MAAGRTARGCYAGTRRAHHDRLRAAPRSVRIGDAGFDPGHSDLDFVVVFDDLAPVERADAFFALKEGVESLFEQPVDLVVERAIRNPYVRARVESERRAVHAG